MAPNSGPKILRSLVGSELSSVIFVRDYLQLAFEPSQSGVAEAGVLRPSMSGAFGTLDAITLPQLVIEGRRLRPGDDGYRDALVEQIGRRLTGADDERDRIRLGFDNGVLATISLAVEDLVPGQVESAILQLDDDDKSWMVWRPADQSD